MTDNTFLPGESILFMKVGTHANEPLERIIKRKQQEIEEAGYAMWGYGGNTCHPSMVQPFARSSAESGHVVRLCMEPMDSKHFAERIRAAQYSVDDSTWLDVPGDINVRGSRFALCIRELHQLEAQATLPLDATRVAIGRSKGRVGSDYIRGRVDKACLEIIDTDENPTDGRKIGLVADLIEPYAVYLR